MYSYAAIELSKETIGSILGNVAEVPAGTERLAWALLRYPFTEGVTHYYIGGNYLRLNHPDYMKQILTQEELDELFTYRRGTGKPAGRGRPDPAFNWFPVRPREGVADAVLAANPPRRSHRSTHE